MIANTYKTTLKGQQKLFIWTLGDVGFGGARFDESSFNLDHCYLVREMERGNVVKIMGGGDYLAQTSPTERAAIVSAKGGKGFYDSTLDSLDSYAISDCDKFIDKMAPFKGHILGMGSGHHLYEFSKRSVWYGINSDEYVAKKLKADYWGTVARICLHVNQDRYSFLNHHGYGSGRTRGAAITKRARALEGFTVDFVLMGHDNRRLCEVTNQLGDTGYREIRVVGTGAYEKAYDLGQAKGGYVEEGLMNPSALGAAVIMVEIFMGKPRVRALI